jgi:AcrR family transcriptional regulator
VARNYELKKRAQSQALTRLRIVEATVAMHETVGPLRTTISAIAERAGVQRLTVYRHFPDERSLFAACASHWTGQNPMPDLAAWAAVDDPQERLQIALGDVYDFFRATEGMTANLVRDLPDSAVMREVATPFAEYWQAARGVLLRGWDAHGSHLKLLRAVIGHAVEFETWRSLVRGQQLSDTEAAAAMVSLARAVA